MRTTFTLDDDLIEELREGLGIKETSAVVRQALIELRQRLAAERLIALGGSDPDAIASPRRRASDFTNPD
jgi:Arc/MetJ family transcription regulator